MHSKQYYIEKGMKAFESGKRIACFGGTSWQAKAYKQGYELAKGYSLIYADTPEEYQINKLKGMIDNGQNQNV